MLSGCGEEEEENSFEIVDAFFLTEADIKKLDSIRSIEKDKLIGEICDESELYANRPEDTSDKASACFNKIFAEVKARASETKLSLRAKVDLSSCIPEIFNQGTGVSLNGGQIEFVFYAEAECQAGGLAKFNDMP